MNKMLKKTIAVFLCIWMLCLTGIAAFAASEQPFEVPASIKISNTTLSMLYGATAQLTATVQPDGSDQRVTWTSSNMNLVAVDGNGKLTAAKDTAETPSGKQTVTITVASVSAPSVKATCTVTVDNDTSTKLKSTLEMLKSLLTALFGALKDPMKELTTTIIDFVKQLIGSIQTTA